MFVTVCHARHGMSRFVAVCHAPCRAHVTMKVETPIISRSVGSRACSLYKKEKERKNQRKKNPQTFFEDLLRKRERGDHPLISPTVPAPVLPELVVPLVCQRCAHGR